jgi:hypothetical protein
MLWWRRLSHIAVTLVVHLCGLQDLLPLLPEPDQRADVTPALRLAAMVSLNPSGFGHLGSTVIGRMVFLRLSAAFFDLIGML